MRPQHLRVARATRQLDAIQHFYTDVLGFTLIGGFTGHEGFDGVMLAHPDSDWHLEFTTEAAAAPDVFAPPPDTAIVLYFAEKVFDAVVARALTNGRRAVCSHNPYWDRHGITIEDPDGYRVVLHRGPWTIN